MERIKSSLTKPTTIIQIVGSLFSVGLLFYLLSQQGWGEIKDAILDIPLWRLALAMGIMMVSRLSVIARWYTLLRSAKIEITYKQTARITFAGMFLTTFLPTTVGGDLIRLLGAIQMKLDGAICTASLIVDRLVGLSGMLMAVPFAVPFLLAYPGFQESSRNNLNQFSFFISGAWLRKTWMKILDTVKRVFGALQFWRNKPLALGKSLAWSWLHMLCLFTIIFLLLAGIDESLPLWKIAGFYSLVYLVTLIPISINGYGVQEITMTFVLSNLGGISISGSITIALLFRTLMMLASLPGVLFVPSLLSRRLSDKK